MTQIVGLFLGGTGKYVAELLKGWAREYRWDFNNFAVFDVDTLEQLRGPYELGDDLVPPPNDFTVLVDRVIAQWAEDDVARDTSRGSRAFETSVLYNVARGLTREKLAPNSGLWTLRSTGLPATQALANAGAGQDAVTNAVGAANQLVQNRGNDGVQLMVVASSAGGTGSGFTVPFALQARRGFGDAPVEIVTLLAGASAFEKTWKDNDSNIRSRGLSGTFAVFREIDFLSAKPEEFSTPGVREIPAAGGLRYFEDNPVALQPGTPVASYQLARTAYWVGRRSRIDTVADAYACLQELARFYAALSNAGLASRSTHVPSCNRRLSL